MINLCCVANHNLVFPALSAKDIYLSGFLFHIGIVGGIDQILANLFFKA